MENFAPLAIRNSPPRLGSIDTKGNNLIEKNKESFNEKKAPVMERIFSQVKFIK